ncbi:MAG: hypothetical protein K2L64_01465, partial [Ureaplasma sp.]|nr:hypothetical protein [Ureaplasma sp.]
MSKTIFKNNKFFMKIKEYFPDSKNKWKQFTITSILVILAAIIFALNSFVDNFMSTNIKNGNQALSYANTWGAIITGVVSLTTIVGSAIFAQFLGKGDIQKVKETIKLRVLFAFFITLPLCFPSWIDPKWMIRVVSGFDNGLDTDIISSASNYLQLITVSWIINSVLFTYAMVLREKHHGIASFLCSLISLLLNIILNSIFVYGLHKGLEFLAYSTIISYAVSLIFVLVFIWIKDKNIWINFFKIFGISKLVFKLFFKRIWSFLLLSLGSISVSIRFIFWNMGYESGSVGNELYQISAATVLGISGMFFNIFWTALEAANTNVAIYVGKELGINNFEEAKKNAKQLQGFHLIVSTTMGLLLFAFSFVIEQMNFLADGYRKGLEAAETLSTEQINIACKYLLSTIKFTLWPLAFFMPMFLWFITRIRVLAAGGYTNLVGGLDASVGWFQIVWLVLIVKVFNSGTKLEFAIAYFIFFLSDIVKFVLYEIVYSKINWVRNITNQEDSSLQKKLPSKIAKFDNSRIIYNETVNHNINNETINLSNDLSEIINDVYYE